MYNAEMGNPSSDPAVADRLRKQCKTRAIRLIKDSVYHPQSGFDEAGLKGHLGSRALQEQITELLLQKCTPIEHSKISSAIVFTIPDKAIGGGPEGDYWASKSKQKKVKSDGKSKTTAHSAHQAGGGIPMEMLLSGAEEQDAGSLFPVDMDATAQEPYGDELMGQPPGETNFFGQAQKPEAKKRPKKGEGQENPADKYRKEADASLQAYEGEAVYMFGTGLARETKTEGILRFVGGLLRIEVQGVPMGFNEFCATASNTKKRPRENVYFVRTDRSLAYTAEQLVGPPPEVAPKPGASAASAAKSTPGKKKKKNDPGAAAHQPLARAVFQASQSHESNDETFTMFDQDKIDFTPVMAEDRQSDLTKAKHAREMTKCKNILKVLLNHRHGWIFAEPVDISMAPDYLEKISQPMDLGSIKNKMENGAYNTHQEFAADVRLVWSNAMTYNVPGHDVYETAQTLSENFEARYAVVIADSVAEEVELNSIPESLAHVPQRHLDEWVVFDENGNFIPPWYGSDARFPGGVCGTLIVPEGCYDVVPLQIRLEAPAEWHARCIDSLGCQLPEYWVKTENAWYMLGKPFEPYQKFLMEESSWLMATYRITSFLNQCPKATFEEGFKVLEGKNWRKNSEPAKLKTFNLDMIMDKAEHMVAEISSINPKFASHKFCTALLLKAKKNAVEKEKAAKKMTSGSGAGGGGSSKKKRGGTDGHDDEPAIVCGVNHGWQWRDDLTHEEQEVRVFLHDIIKKIEKKMRPRRPIVDDTGADWSCQWCSVDLDHSGGRCPGPDGPSTLCSACGSRFRNGHTSAPVQDENGLFVCEGCHKTFETIRGLGSHRRGCSGGHWKCEWCSCLEATSGGKCPGPNGPKTLCSACGSRFRNGHVAPPMQNADGKLLCPKCGKAFETMISLGGHKRFCDGGNWTCAWCKCTPEESGGKSPGPDGPKTLCSPCGSRFRNGHMGPPIKDEHGNFVCDDCGKTFDTISGLGGHRRFCENLARKGKKAPKLYDDLELIDMKKQDGSYVELAASTTEIMSNLIPKELQSEVVQVWDTACYLISEVLGHVMPCTWETFLSLLVGRTAMRHRDPLAQIHMSMTVVLYKELPGADVVNPFKGRPLNRHTWQELLRQYLANETADLNYTQCANLADEDAKLGVPFRKSVARRVNAHVTSLGEKEYADMTFQERLDVLSTLCELVLDTNMTRKHIDTAIDDSTKLAHKKRDEYSSRLREIEQDLTQKAEEKAEGEKAEGEKTEEKAEGEKAEEQDGGEAGGEESVAADQTTAEAQPCDTPSKPGGVPPGTTPPSKQKPKVKAEGKGDTMEVDGEDVDKTPEAKEKKRLSRKVDVKVLREAEDAERKQIDARYKALRLELGTVRRECLGMDRYYRRYWQLGVLEIGRLGSWKEQCSLWIEPGPTGRERRTVDGKDGVEEDVWVQVKTSDELKRLIDTLVHNGQRENVLKANLLSIQDALEKAFAAKAEAEAARTAEEPDDESALLRKFLLKSVREPVPVARDDGNAAVEETNVQEVVGEDAAEDADDDTLAIRPRKRVKPIIDEDTESDNDDDNDSDYSCGGDIKIKEPRVKEIKDKKEEAMIEDAEDADSDVEGKEVKEVKDEDEEDEDAEVGGEGEKMEVEAEAEAPTPASRQSKLTVINLDFECRARGYLKQLEGETPGDSFARAELDRREAFLAQVAAKKTDEGSDEAAKLPDEKEGEVPAVKPPEPFVGARVSVRHDDGKSYGGILCFFDQEKDLWHIIFEDGEEDDLAVPSDDSVVVSIIEQPPPCEQSLSDGIILIKRDLLDILAALPPQATLWWEIRKHVWEKDVRFSRSCAHLNDLVQEFARCIHKDFLETWWQPWDGYETATKQQIVTRRCRYYEGGANWHCKSASIPGKNVCKRHLKKQLATAGVSGFQVVLRPNDAPVGIKGLKVGMAVEVQSESEWWNARVVKISRKGDATVQYEGDTGELEIISDKTRLRHPTDNWDTAGQEDTAGAVKKEEDGEEDGEKDGEKDSEKDGEKDGENEDGDEDEDGDEENPGGKFLIMANEDAVTTSAVLLRVHSLDEALRSPLIPRPFHL